MFKEIKMSVSEWIVRVEGYDKGFYDGSNYILALLYQNKTTQEIRENINSFEAKYFESKKILDEIKERNKQERFERNAKAKKVKAKKTKNAIPILNKVTKVKKQNKA